MTAPSIGFIGLGDIGLPMARCVLRQAGGLTVWNRSADKGEELVREGAVRAGSPADLARQCDIVGLCLTSHDAVEAVVFGEDGVLAGADGRHRILVDCSTGDPGRAVEFAARAAAVGAGWVDAPVSGGVGGAEAGALIVFAGGSEEDVAGAAPLLISFAARISHMGSAGAGQTTKLCNQVMVACGVLVMAETLAMARRAGVDVEQLPAALQGGFADSTPFQVFGPRMAAHRFLPRMGAIALMEKDLRLARDMAEAAGAQAPISELCLRLYESVGSKPGLSPEADLSAVIGLFEPLGGVA